MKTILEYKGYIAEVEFDELSGLYCGAVINMGDQHGLILEIPRRLELQGELRKAIDFCLADCAEDGTPVEPPREISPERKTELARGLALARAQVRDASQYKAEAKLA